MAMKYLKVFYDWPETTQFLKPAQKGELIDALVRYARGEPDAGSSLKGTAQAVFPSFKRQIDQDSEQYSAQIDRNRENGKKGGRPKKETQKNPVGFSENPENPVGFSETHNNPDETQWVFSETQKSQDKDKEEDKEKDKEKEKEEEEDNIAAAGRPDFDTVEVYAANNLTRLSPGNMEEMAAFKEELPEELIRHAIDTACANGKPSFAYARAIMARYRDCGYKSIGDVKAAEEKRAAEKGTAASYAGKKQSAANFQERSYTEQESQKDYFDLKKWFEEMEGG